MPEGQITVDDPRSGDVRALLARHLAFAHSHIPASDCHALDIDGLLGPEVTFCSFRLGGELLGVGALKRLDSQHAELKSLHTAEAARRRGVGRAIVGHLIGLARDRGFRRISLETGAIPAFEPSRALYASAGFQPCEPFGDYRPSRYSAFMTLTLDGPAPGPLTAGPSSRRGR